MNGLKEKRQEAKLSRFKLAVAVGVSPQTIENWEKGVTFPPLDKAITLCQVLHCDIHQLL